MKFTMKFTMVESPYTTPHYGRLECIRYALWCCVDSNSRGECCIASHLFFTQFIPETEAGRERGLLCRDEVARRTVALIARYVDLGQTPGMFRRRDGSATVEERKLSGEIRLSWLKGRWPDSSTRLEVL